MNLFPHIKVSKKDEALELAIELKYGKPVATDEYLESLPDTVVEAAHNILSEHARIPQSRRLILSIYLRQPVNKPKAEKAISDSLYIYHALLGRL